MAARGGGLRVFLSGFMAAGKTTVGRELAARLGIEFVDLDERIEARQGGTIAEIFADRGEQAFRDLESEELERLLGRESMVLALGGGTLLRAANRRRLESAGTVVWLDTARSTILSRLRDTPSGRPLHVDGETTARLLAERRRIYRHCDVRIRPRRGETPAAIAARIAARVTR